jgi:hypothetical protein
MPGGQHESRDKASSRGIEANDDKESDQKDTIQPSLRHTHTTFFLGSSDSKSFAPTLFKSARAPGTFKGKCNRRLSRSHRNPSPLVISLLPPTHARPRTWATCSAVRLAVAGVLGLLVGRT